MCGITGIISKSASYFIEKSTLAIAHRGPDDFGIFQDEYVALGHRRLAIQDLSANGHQPMFSNDQRFCIIFNGEIYNHWEIRKTLEHQYPFKSHSDTETILYGYLAYGENIFKMLNGIFALAIYDTITHDIIIARDHFGVKPLYYFQKNNSFAFASEIKAIEGLPDFDREIDPQALVNYIHFLYSPQEKTPFKYVKKLLPGHFLKFNTRQYIEEQVPLEYRKYYDIPFSGTYSTKTEQVLIDELDEKLYKAVERQLLSDVPVGFFLSGGLDSSAIVAMAKRILGDKKLACYTIDTSDRNSREGFASDLDYAQKVAKHLNVDLEIVQGTPDVLHEFDKMIYHLDEPQADIAPIHVLNICKKAREKGHIVLLGGTAGDDLFSGYRRHQALRYEPYFNLIPDIFSKILKSGVASIKSDKSFVRRVKKILKDIDKTPTERMAGYYGWIDIMVNKHLFKESLQSSIAEYEPNDILIDALQNIPEENILLNQMLYWDMKYFLTDHNLNYTDKLSMAVGVEVRVPFLDKELVEFSTMIPPGLKLKGITTKYLLKKVMERYLPLEVIYRPKTGFGVPLRDWIVNDLKDFIEERLIHNPAVTDIFNDNEIKKLLKNNQENKLDASYTILALMAIVSWYEQFVKVKQGVNYRK
jgi:asparagine synthase (glutamine-hydrolysing)